ncbi:MAG: MucB/RseB C-terminal domain-containing protein [Polaromonas sp.]|uniref:MucB/RseB C-terminal domain-containing protein n=1 Tax=Polaromonas sp. TaxID=1869339 RepID=UPI0017C4E22E|nr:MucB/RseB C-terminal domain-containing protein [Polaromonas sp.]MBA3593538.1 MucB/RseB C-terminal domain-containing protein [Polaromonas sp.]
MNFKLFRLLTLVGCALSATNYVAAQAPAPVAPAQAAESKNINEWLMRMHEASRNRSYIGTFVVSSGGVMSSAKIWHVCDGKQQIERVDTLTGPRRSTFRHNDQVVTFLPEQNLVRTEKRESLGLFPALLQSTSSHIGDFYQATQEGRERVAGVDADVIALMPKDGMRFGYRVWAEQKKGLVVKLQTLDADGKVLEQAAFSELQIDAPVKIEKLAQMMNKVDGYRVEKSGLVKTTASAEGWALKRPVPGFQPMSCHKRPRATPAGDEPMQWVFSDGLASVSIFVESFDAQRHGKESRMTMGATQSLTRRVDAWWLTVIGEVPMATLGLFADGLERRK